MHKEKFNSEGFLFDDDLLIAGYQLYSSHTGWIQNETVLRSLQKKRDILPNKIEYYGEKPPNGKIYLISYAGKC